LHHGRSAVTPYRWPTVQPNLYDPRLAPVRALYGISPIEVKGTTRNEPGYQDCKGNIGIARGTPAIHQSRVAKESPGRVIQHPENQGIVDLNGCPRMQPDQNPTRGRSRERDTQVRGVHRGHALRGTPVDGIPSTHLCNAQQASAPAT